MDYLQSSPRFCPHPRWVNFQSAPTGHILFCVDGELHTELADGRTFVLTSGMSYQVADQAEPHRSSTATGATLFIVD
ncbi:MAG: DHCW motif cupin fold protein [Herminiimonas sp.]|nr:DHCW motif cupin fold protein [Herminiimonas sp.]